MSEESDQGDGRELVSELWAGAGSGMEVLDGPKQSSDMV